MKIWCGWGSGFIVVVTPRNKATKQAASSADAVNARPDRKAKSREILVIFTYIRLSSPRDLVLCTGNLHAMGPFRCWQRLCFCLEPARQFMRPRWRRQGGLPVAGCALVLPRVHLTVQATALAAARWLARQQAPFRQGAKDPSSKHHGMGLRAGSLISTSVGYEHTKKDLTGR